MPFGPEKKRVVLKLITLSVAIMIKKEAHINIMCLIQKENYKKSHKNQFFRPGNGVSCLTGDSRMWQPHWGKGDFFLSGQGLVPDLRTLPTTMRWALDSRRKVTVKSHLSTAFTSVSRKPWGVLDLLTVPMATEAVEGTKATSHRAWEMIAYRWLASFGKTKELQRSGIWTELWLIHAIP